MPPKKGSLEEKGSSNEGDTHLGQNVENEAAAFLLATQRFREGQVSKRRRRASFLMDKDRSPEEDAELELLLKDLLGSSSEQRSAQPLERSKLWRNHLLGFIKFNPLQVGSEELDGTAQTKGNLPMVYTALGIVDKVVDEAKAYGIDEDFALVTLLNSVPADDTLYPWAQTPEAKRACADHKGFIAEMLASQGTSMDGLKALLAKLWTAAALWSGDRKYMLMSPRTFILYNRNLWEARARMGAVMGEDNAVCTVKEKLGEAWGRVLLERETLNKRIAERAGKPVPPDILTFAELLKVVQEESEQHPDRLVLLASPENPAPAFPARHTRPDKAYEYPRSSPNEDPKMLKNGKMSKIPDWLYRHLCQPCGCQQKGHEDMTFAFCKQADLHDFCAKGFPSNKSSSQSRQSISRNPPSVKTRVLKKTRSSLKESFPSTTQVTKGREKEILTSTTPALPRSTGPHPEKLVMTFGTATMDYVLNADTNNSTQHRCILDSGAFAHITNDVRPLQNIRDLAQPLTISGVGQQQVTRQGFHPVWGNMYILQTLPITVLSLGQFLLSDTHDVDWKKPDYTVVHSHGSELFRFDRVTCLWWHEVGIQQRHQRHTRTCPPNQFSLLASDDGQEEDPHPHFTAVVEHILAQASQDILNLDDVEVIDIADDFAEHSCYKITPDTTVTVERVQRRHHSLGHPGPEVMASLAKHGHLDGITLNDVQTWEQQLCHACAQGRSKAPAAVSTLSKEWLPPSQPGETLHLDIFFIHGAKNIKQAMVMITDQATGWTRARRMVSQTTAELARITFEAVFFLRAYGHEPKTVGSDREANLDKLQHLLQEVGVHMRYAPEGRKNARVEAKTGIIRAMARATSQGMLVPLPHRYTAALFEDTAEAYNLLPNKTIGLQTGKAPYDIIHKREDRGYLINARADVPFGGAILAHLPQSQHGKKAEGFRHNCLIPPSEYGFVIGRNHNTAHTVLAYFPRRLVSLQTSQMKRLERECDIEPTTLQLWRQMYADDCPPGTPQPLTHRPSAAPRLSTLEKSYFTPAHRVPTDTSTTKLPCDIVNVTIETTQAGTKKHSLFFSRKKEPAHQVLKDPLGPSYDKTKLHQRMLRHLLLSAERIPLREARKNKDEFEAAALVEAKKLVDNNVLRPVLATKVPHNAVRGRGLQVVERKNGSMTVRCVFDKKFKDGVNHSEFYAPTARAASTIMIATIAEAQKLQMRVVDVKRAFLHSPLAPDNPYHIEMRGEMAAALVQLAPETFGPFYDKTKDLLICHLLKALYGLEEASLAWYKELSTTMKKLKFKVHPYDTAIFYRRLGSNLTVAGTHVDDILLAGHPTDLQEVETYLDTKYGIKRQQGTSLTYLGLQLDWRTEGTAEVLHIHQTDYEEQILKNLPPNYIIKDEDNPTGGSVDFWKTSEKATKLSATEKDNFNSILHKVMFLASRTRPELALGTSFLSKRKDQATDHDKAKLCKILGYIQATKGDTIKILPKNLQLSCFADASFAPYPYEDRKVSQIGFLLSIGGSWILSKSSRTKITCDSATAAEVYSLHESLREVMWARYFLQELGFKQNPIPIYEDNDGVVKLVRLTSG